MEVALYKGTRPGWQGLYNRLGRVMDHGPYSHMELVLPNGLSASASALEGGVRIKDIGYSTPENWDFIQIPDAYGPQVESWFSQHLGQPYDVWGNIKFCFGFVSDSSDRWFCSEAGMAALGDIAEPSRYGPNGAALYLLDRIHSGFWNVPFPANLAITYPLRKT